MLGRKRELILIVSGLIALNVLLGWLLVGRWKEYRKSTQWLSQGVAPQRALASATGSNQAGQPSSFVDIVDRNVFSPLRGSVPARAQEETKAPRLPVLFGTMNLGSGRFALMSPGDQSPPHSKRVLPGEEIGGYKLVSIGTSNVVVEWQDKRTTLEITAPAPAPRVPGVTERTANVRTGAGTTPPSASGAAAVVVPETGLGASATGRTGQPGAPPDVPVGTVVGGKRKVLVQSPFGPLVQWEDVNATGSPTQQQSGAPNKP
jgi:hypothetical protein